MAERNDGGPAFARPRQWSPGSTHAQGGEIDPGAPGMSLRDWFAGQALVAMGLARPTTGVSDSFRRQAADQAYAYADQMLIARRL